MLSLKEKAFRLILEMNQTDQSCLSLGLNICYIIDSYKRYDILIQLDMTYTDNWTFLLGKMLVGILL